MFFRRWESHFKLLPVKLLFSVYSSTYSLNYSEKYALYLGKFWLLVLSVPGPLFHLPPIAKRCAEDEVACLPILVVISLTEMELSVLILILTSMLWKKLNSPPRFAILRDFYNQVYRFTIPESQIRLVQPSDLFYRKNCS